MGVMVEALQTVIVRELNTFAREIEMFPDDELMWRTLPGVTNSAANLALHVSGNLQHFIGAVLGKSGYVRNREVELGTRRGTRAEVVAELRKTIAVVEHVLPTTADDALLDQYPALVHGMTIRTDRFLLHLATHLAHHLGQAGYLRRIQTVGESSDPLPLKALLVDQ